MSLTISLSGMDAATETALRAAFNAANARIGDQYTLVPEPDSQHVIVDMDSMYGPMSWLRLHAAGKSVVGLTSAPRVQTHYRIGRPFDEQSMLVLLREIAEAQGVSLDAAVSAAPTPASPDAAAAVPPASDAPALRSVASPASSADESGAAVPAGASSLAPTGSSNTDTPVVGAAAEAGEDTGAIEPVEPAVEPAQPTGTETATSTPVSTFASHPLTDSAALLRPVANADAEIAPPAPAAPRERSFADWLVPGALRGRLRYQHDAGPTLWIDADAREYFGPSTLKPVGQYFTGAIEREAFEPVDDATWAKESTVASAHPLARLQWLGGLLAGEAGQLEGMDPEGRFVLGKWPQTEREYPRHFRIATAMMKGPATLDEIAAASGLPRAEVVAFVSANLATGYAQAHAEAPETPEEPQKAAGFFSRLRRR